MQMFLIIVLLFVQSPVSLLSDWQVDRYIDTVRGEFRELDYASGHELEQLLSFVRKHSLHEMDPEILKEYVLEGIIMSLGDDYAAIENRYESSFLDSLEGKYSGFGFDLGVIGESPGGNYVITNVLEGSAAYRAGIKPGDLIDSINGIKVHANRKLYEGAMDMVGSDGVHKLSIRRGKKTLHFDLKPVDYEEPAVSVRTINKDIYYIKINNCSLEMPLYVESELKKVRDFQFEKVIIDLRHNLGGWEDSVIKVCAMMCDEEVIAYYNDRSGVHEIKREGTEQITDLKPIVLISRDTASSAELLAACLKKHAGATLVGEKTYGKNRSQGVYEFGGRVLKFTNGILSADQNFPLNFSGIDPDIVIEGMYEEPERDKALEKAMELLN